MDAENSSALQISDQRRVMLWITIGLAVLSAITAYATWSAWRDADNWSLDSSGTKIRFRNWTELSAMGLLTAILLILVVFMAL